VSTHNASPRLPVSLATGLILCLLIAGMIGSGIVSIGCSEGATPGTAGAKICSAFGEFLETRWWMITASPAAAQLLLTFAARRRSALVGSAMALFASMVVAYALLVAVLTDNFP
jgi:hypothetical protein